MKYKQGNQELEALAFCVVNANDKHMKRSFKRNLGGKFKESICAELPLKLWFESDWQFLNITESELF